MGNYLPNDLLFRIFLLKKAKTKKKGSNSILTYRFKNNLIKHLSHKLHTI